MNLAKSVAKTMKPAVFMVFFAPFIRFFPLSNIFYHSYIIYDYVKKVNCLLYETIKIVFEQMRKTFLIFHKILKI